MKRRAQLILERLLQWVRQDIEEVKQAKREFLERVGEIPDDDAYYEEHMAFFVNWFLLVRWISSTRKTPIEAFRDSLLPEQATPQEQEILQNLIGSTFSMFKINKIATDKIVVVDLFDGLKYKVSEDHLNTFLYQGQIITAWVYLLNDTYLMVDGACLHPLEVSKIVAKGVKDRGAMSKIDLILKYAALKTKTRRFPRLDVQRIYNDEL